MFRRPLALLSALMSKKARGALCAENRECLSGTCRWTYTCG